MSKNKTSPPIFVFFVFLAEKSLLSMFFRNLFDFVLFALNVNRKKMNDTILRLDPVQPTPSINPLSLHKSLNNALNALNWTPSDCKFDADSKAGLRLPRKTIFRSIVKRPDLQYWQHQEWAIDTNFSTFVCNEPRPFFFFFAGHRLDLIIPFLHFYKPWIHPRTFFSLFQNYWFDCQDHVHLIKY